MGGNFYQSHTEKLPDGWRPSILLLVYELRETCGHWWDLSWERGTEALQVSPSVSEMLPTANSMIPLLKGPIFQGDPAYCGFVLQRNQDGWMVYIVPDLCFIYVVLLILDAGHSHVYLYMLVYVHICVHVCTCIYKGQRTTSCCVLHVPVNLFCEIVSLMAWTTPSSL